MSQNQHSPSHLTQRRRFLNLGLATITSGVLGIGSRNTQANPVAAFSPEADDKAGGGSASESPVPKIDIEKWRKLKSEPYEVGAFGEMPGVCNLPGPLAKRNWPDRNKYKGAVKVPGMCQLCRTVCGMIG